MNDDVVYYSMHYDYEHDDVADYSMYYHGYDDDDNWEIGLHSGFYGSYDFSHTQSFVSFQYCMRMRFRTNLCQK